MITHVELNRLEVKNLKRLVLSPSRCKKSSDSPFSTPKKKTWLKGRNFKRTKRTVAQYLAVFFGYENNDSRDAERSRGDTKPLATQAKWTAFLLRIILLNLLNIKQTIYKVTCTQAPSFFPRCELFLLHYSRSLLLSTGHSPNLKHHSAPIALWCRVVSFLVSNHFARNATWL